jgi:hypothetical protein
MGPGPGGAGREPPQRENLPHEDSFTYLLQANVVQNRFSPNYTKLNKSRLFFLLSDAFGYATGVFPVLPGNSRKLGAA